MADISKRTFLQGIAATLGAATVDAVAATGHPEGQWDVIVVGAGTAGLPAAIFAAARGAKVLLLEKTNQIGGTLAIADAQIAAAGTVFQKAKGIVDTPEAHYEDAWALCNGTAEPDMVKLYTQYAAEIVDWLAANGFTILPNHPTATGYNGSFRTARYMQGVEGGRSILAALRPALAKAVAEGNVTLAIRTRLVELTHDRLGAVTGLITEDDDGRRTTHHARNVVLSAGGASGNAAMYEQLHGVPLYGREAFQANQGDAIRAAVAIGARLWHQHNYIPYIGAILADTNYPSPRLGIAAIDAKLRQPWEICVNTRGERFMREDDPDQRQRLLEVGHQPGHRYWIVFDDTILQQAPPLVPSLSSGEVVPHKAASTGKRTDREDLMEHFAFHPSFAQADTLDDLAVKLGVDRVVFARTVADYNAAVASKTDAFGREHMPRPIAKSPFYGILHQGWSFMTFAGLEVDDRLRVMGKTDNPIPNLFAAGETIGGGATGGKAQTLGGYVTPALTFGYLIGKHFLPL